MFKFSVFTEKENFQIFLKSFPHLFLSCHTLYQTFQAVQIQKGRFKIS